MKIVINTADFCKENQENIAYFIRYEEIGILLKYDLEQYIKQLLRKYNIDENNLLSVNIKTHYDYLPIIGIHFTDKFEFDPNYKIVKEKIENTLKYWFETFTQLYNKIYDKLRSIFNIPEYSNYYYLKYLSFRDAKRNFALFDGYADEEKILRIQNIDFKDRKNYNNLYVTLNFYIKPELIKEIKELLKNITNSNYKDIETYFRYFNKIKTSDFEKHFIQAFNEIVKNQNPIILDQNVKEYFVNFYIGMREEKKGIFLIPTICVHYTGDLNLDYLYLDKLKNLFLETTVLTYKYLIAELL